MLHLRSAVDGDLDLEDMPEERSTDEYKEALDFIKEALGEEHVHKLHSKSVYPDGSPMGRPAISLA